MTVSDMLERWALEMVENHSANNIDLITQRFSPV